MRKAFKNLQERRRSRSRSVDVGSDGYNRVRRESNAEPMPRLSGGPVPFTDPAVSDTTVNRVLRDTRGQQGPVVRGMNDTEGYGGYGSEEPRRSSRSMSRGRHNDSISSTPATPVTPIMARGRQDYDVAGSPRGPSATRNFERQSVDEPRGRRSVDEYNQRLPVSSTTATGAMQSIPRKSVDRSRNIEETARSAYSGSNPMSPAVGSTAIPPRKAVNRDSLDGAALKQNQTILNESNHAGRTSMDATSSQPVKPTIMSQGLATHVSPSNTQRSDLGRNIDGVRVPAEHGYANNSIGQAITTPTTSTNQASISRKPVAREPLASSAPITAYSDTIGTNAGVSSRTNATPEHIPSKAADRAILTQKAAQEDLMDQTTRVPTVASGRTASTASSAVATGVATRQKLHGIAEGVPLTDQNYTTTNKVKGLGRWPLEDITRDPADTKYYLGKSHNVAEGPISAVFASTYAEPDMYSSTVHVHREETKLARAVVHEKLQQRVHYRITEKIHRDIHEHDIYVHIQPLIDIQYLPDRHWVQDSSGELIEVTESLVNILRAHAGYQEINRYEEKIDYLGNSTLRQLKPGEVVDRKMATKFREVPAAFLAYHGYGGHVSKEHSRHNRHHERQLEHREKELEKRSSEHSHHNRHHQKQLEHREKELRQHDNRELRHENGLGHNERKELRHEERRLQDYDGRI